MMAVALAREECGLRARLTAGPRVQGIYADLRSKRAALRALRLNKSVVRHLLTDSEQLRWGCPHFRVAI